MDKINYNLSGFNDMDKVIVFLKKRSKLVCHTKKMIFRKEEVNQFTAREIFKVDGYISRYENDLEDEHILLNVPDIWFWDVDQKAISREEDFDLVFVPKLAIARIQPSVETVIHRFVKELKYEV